MTEHDEQKALIQRAAYHPVARKIFAIPNGGLRNKIIAKKLKAEGVKAGTPDLMLPVARHGFNGLFIELKRGKGISASGKKHAAGKATENQIKTITQLNDDGYLAVICTGADAAWQTIEDYLREEK